MAHFNDDDLFYDWLHHIETHKQACSEGCDWTHPNIPTNSTLESGINIIVNSSSFDPNWLLWLMLDCYSTLSRNCQTKILTKLITYPGPLRRLKKSNVVLTRRHTLLLNEAE
jgi:hypothetical protein